MTPNDDSYMAIGCISLGSNPAPNLAQKARSAGASHFSDLTDRVGAIPPWLPLHLAGRGSAQGHDPYLFILFQAQRIWYDKKYCLGRENRKGSLGAKTAKVPWARKPRPYKTSGRRGQGSWPAPCA